MKQYNQKDGFLKRVFRPVIKAGLPLMKNIVKIFAKSVLIPLGLTAAASAANAGTHNKILGLGMITLTISNKEMEDIMKIVKSLEESAC